MNVSHSVLIQIILQGFQEQKKHIEAHTSFHHGKQRQLDASYLETRGPLNT